MVCCVLTSSAGLLPQWLYCIDVALQRVSLVADGCMLCRAVLPQSAHAAASLTLGLEQADEAIVPENVAALLPSPAVLALQSAHVPLARHSAAQHRVAFTAQPNWQLADIMSATLQCSAHAPHTGLQHSAPAHQPSCVQTSQQRLDVVQANARATAKAVIRKETAKALRDVLDYEANAATSGTEAASDEEYLYNAAKAKENRMRKVISSLATLASASGVSSERQLFLEVASDEVNRTLDKMNKRGGAPCTPPAACALRCPRQLLFAV